MKKKSIVLVAFIISIFATGNAISAEIAWMHVQHREYGEGKSLSKRGDTV
jgi:hypothetical protein